MLKLSLLLGLAGIALLLAPALAAPAPSLPATPAPAAVQAELAARGQALFSAKGCAQCHSHALVAGSGQFGGSDVPNLSRVRYDAAYLESWLANPQAVRPATMMPNLDLKPAEIKALVAFLRTP